MPLIKKEFKNGQAITEYEGLPSAVNTSKDKVGSDNGGPVAILSRLTSSQSHEVVKRLTDLKLSSESQGQTPPSTTLGTGIPDDVRRDRTARHLDIASVIEDELKEEVVRSDAGGAVEFQTEILSEASEKPHARRSLLVWQDPSNGDPPSIGLVTGDSDNFLIGSPLMLSSPSSAEREGETSQPLAGSITAAANLHKRMSYIGPRGLPASLSADIASTDDFDSFVFAAKRQTPSLIDLGGGGSLTYSRSLMRVLTASSGATSSSPRIYPVAYSPSLAGTHDEEDGEARSEREGETKAHYTPKHSHAPHHQRTSVNSSRSEPKAIAAAALIAHTVQVAGAEEVPPAPLHGYQRSVFLRTQGVMADVFGQPTESHWMKMLNRVIFVLIILNFCVLAAETCEGKNFRGSDPGYPYLPDEGVYKVLDAVISLAFTLELFVRVAAKKFHKAILTDPFTIADFVALVPWYAQLVLNAAGMNFSVDDMNSPSHSVALLRLLRAVRLGNILRHYDQSRILYLSIRASLRPLGITMFFLCTLVMLLATALFYAEPCYNVHTCQFTDIFNSAYFIMVTYVSFIILPCIRKMTG